MQDSFTALNLTYSVDLGDVRYGKTPFYSPSLPVEWKRLVKCAGEQHDHTEGRQVWIMEPPEKIFGSAL